MGLNFASDRAVVNPHPIIFNQWSDYYNRHKQPLQNHSYYQLNRIDYIDKKVFNLEIEQNWSYKEAMFIFMATTTQAKITSLLHNMLEQPNLELIKQKYKISYVKSH